MPSILELRGVTKAFPGVLANDHIDLTLNEGEILALLGENGAGKTTLMNILYGLYTPDEGEIYIAGQRADIRDPNDAIRQGIGMVHQHFMLVPVFTVTENVMLGIEPVRAGQFLDRNAAAARIREISSRFGLEADPDALVDDLPVGVQQRVEIIKILYREADILILDEPTSVLTPQEAGELFKVVRSLIAQGKSVIFITHKLKEVLAIADRITVLRDGRVVGSTTPEETTEAALQVRAGEVLGIAGVQGNGQTQLVEALTGLRHVESGKVTIQGQDTSHATPRAIAEAGTAHVPEDRQRDGLVLSFPVEDNLVMNTYYVPPFAKGIILQQDEIEKAAKERVELFDVRAPSVFVPASNLSGGNQQKVIVAREFSRPIKLLIASQPTRGLDVGSIEYIHRRIVEKRDEGCAVLLVSPELDEIMSLSDRIAVMYKGQILAIVPAEEATKERLGLLMAGIKEEAPAQVAA